MVTGIKEVVAEVVEAMEDVAAGVQHRHARPVENTVITRIAVQHLGAQYATK